MKKKFLYFFLVGVFSFNDSSAMLTLIKSVNPSFGVRFFSIVEEFQNKTAYQLRPPKDIPRMLEVGEYYKIPCAGEILCFPRNAKQPSDCDVAKFSLSNKSPFVESSEVTDMYVDLLTKYKLGCCGDNLVPLLTLSGDELSSTIRHFGSKEHAASGNGIKSDGSSDRISGTNEEKTVRRLIRSFCAIPCARDLIYRTCIETGRVTKSDEGIVEHRKLMVDGRNDARSVVLGKGTMSYFMPAIGKHNSSTIILNLNPSRYACLYKVKKDGTFVVCEENSDIEKVKIATFYHEYLHSYHRLRAPARMLDEKIGYSLSGAPCGISGSPYWKGLAGNLEREHTSALSWALSHERNKEGYMVGPLFVDYHEMRVIFGASEHWPFHYDALEIYTEYLAGDNMSENRLRKSINLPPRGVYVQGFGTTMLDHKTIEMILDTADFKQEDIKQPTRYNLFGLSKIPGLGEEALFVESSSLPQIMECIRSVRP